MKFSEAMKALEEGKKVRCINWPLGAHVENYLDNYSDYKEFQELKNSEWELYAEPEQLLSFAEVVKGLREGKKFRRKNWDSYFISSDKGGIFHYGGKNCAGIRWFPFVDDLEASDWIQVME